MDFLPLPTKLRMLWSLSTPLNTFLALLPVLIHSLSNTVICFSSWKLPHCLPLQCICLCCSFCEALCSLILCVPGSFIFQSLSLNLPLGAAFPGYSYLELSFVKYHIFPILAATTVCKYIFSLYWLSLRLVYNFHWGSPGNSCLTHRSLSVA